MQAVLKAQINKTDRNDARGIAQMMRVGLLGRLLKRSCAHLSDAEAAAYDAPIQDARFKPGVRRFPNLVPDRPDAPGAALSRRARDWWQREWHGRSFTAIGAADPVLGRARYAAAA
jgi:haloalkane dehalogenase/tRNA(adenine34) deaminase